MTNARKTPRALYLALLVAFVLALPLAATAADDTIVYRDSKGLPLWETVEWTDAPVRIVLPDHDSLDTLLDLVPIKSFDREQVDIVFSGPKSFHLVFEPRVTDEERAQLVAAGYDVAEIPDLYRKGREETEALWLARAQGKVELDPSKLNYMTNEDIGVDFTALATVYPNLCRAFVYGQSVQGRDLWAIVISDDVQNTEAEPEVRLSSTIHGDEVVGMVMLHRLAHYLVENYGQAGYEEVTELVDSTELTLIPLYNPDGMALGQRYNAHNVDLNRNFADPDGTHTTQEIENLHAMSLWQSNHFVVGANFHGGAVVFNYLWDWTYDLCPDNAACIQMALAYSTTNLPMYNGSFPQGITNGADWYVASGTLQDWTYYATDCFGATGELSDTKWPSASTLDGYWDDNRQSLINYIKTAGYGINGVVTGSDSGLPLDATITIQGNDKVVHTDPAHGDYYKVLDSGTYTVTVEASGYIPQSFTGVSVTWGSATALDVVLDPAAHGDVSGTVTDLSGTPLDATVRFYNLPTGTLAYTTLAQDTNGGAYSANLIYGDYRVEASSDGFVTGADTVSIDAQAKVVDFELPGAIEVVLFGNDFEGTLDGWTGGWGLADPATGYNSANCLNDSPGDNYSDSADNTMEMVAGVDLSTSREGTVGFWARWEIEDSWDAAYFEVSSDGGVSWTPVATQYTQPANGQGAQSPAGEPCFDDSQAGWVYNSVDLNPWMDETDVRFRFRLSSDTSIHYSGFFVDDFEILVIQQAVESPVAEASLPAARLAVGPNPFNPVTRVRFSVPQDGRASLSVYDVHGHLVRVLADESFASGEHVRTWDGTTDAGGRAASGAYFVLLRSSGQEVVQKVSLIK